MKRQEGDMCSMVPQVFTAFSQILTDKAGYIQQPSEPLSWTPNVELLG